MLAALQTVPTELYEAARVDGANAWQRFRAVTFPWIRHAVIVVILLSSIWTANSFENVWLLTQGGPSDATMVFPVLAYFGMQTEQLGEAAADLHRHPPVADRPRSSPPRPWRSGRTT